ncbi:hypothetical protein CSKR_108734 [Clonorchis sinensis]|uniref:Uncharacterized protein n=1 Tax=Clonorchis sinensis TaxID=79923 RepID=A0A8T1M079_CLOSI|nr:hypothetical protein CSKR_108734 [Clonorchis sinensis]
MRYKKRQSSLGFNTNNEDVTEQPRYTRNHRIRYEQTVPHQFTNNLVPVNAFEQKDRFLRRNLTPEFHLNIPTSELESALLNGSGNITFTLFREATRILDIVCRRFKSIDNFVEQSFGPRISIEKATEKIREYIRESNLPTSLDVIWCEDLVGSALMCSTGIDKNGNIPRQRKFTMLLKTNEENTYLRERGITCLMDHELGTHYHRSFNEGLQPWYGKRDIYGLGTTNTNEAVKIEEGLACIHTILRAEHRYLGIPALLYYGSCMAEYLPFKDLFEHLGKYVENEEQRWKHCMRIKRCLPSQDRCGGYGKDQRYFEGAVTILRQQANIDFFLLMAGKLTLNEVDRVRRSAIMPAVRLPTFMLNKERYLAALRQIARVNGIPIAKRTTEKTRATSVTVQSEKRIRLDASSASRRTSSASFCSPRPVRHKSSPQSLRTASISETDGNEAGKLRNRKPPARDPDQTIQLPRIEPVLTDSSISEFVAQRTSSPNLSAAHHSHSSADVPQFSALGSGTSGVDALGSDVNPIDSVREAVRNRIIRALKECELPNVDLTNLNTQSSGTNKLDENRQPYPKLTTPKTASMNGEMRNEIKSLPVGVCGCRLFTHGNLRAPSNELSQPIPTSDHNDPRGMTKANVPIILEIDLRHPLISV